MVEILDHNGTPFKPSLMADACRLMSDAMQVLTDTCARITDERLAEIRIEALREACGAGPMTIKIRRPQRYQAGGHHV